MRVYFSKYGLFFILLASIHFCILPTAHAQFLRSQMGQRQLNDPPIPPIGQEQSKKIDTVYSFATKKQYGWYEPLGIIPLEVVTKRHYSYRFTHRNDKGRWCKMEIIDGYGNYIPGSISPYIVKLGSSDTDPLANQDWVEKLETACIFEFIPDPSGDRIIQERAYDENMNIVYVYSRTPVGNKQFVGSYKDNYGHPAEMRSDTTGTYTYGTLVILTEDEWGNDSVIEFMDAKGARKLNADGVAMEVSTYDRDGHILKQQSRDVDGKLVLDNWGNCGIEYVWNNNHTLQSATYMDEYWRPMRMPSLRAKDAENIIRFKYKYDRNFRLTEESFWTEREVPDTNSMGIHKIIYEFDDHGNLTLGKNIGLDDQLVDNEVGFAIQEAEFDVEGRTKALIYRDKNMKPLSTPGYFSRLQFQYDAHGNEILSEKYIVVEGEEQLFSKTEVGKDYCYRYQREDDGSCRIDSLDSYGRTYFTAFYDQNGHLGRADGWATEISQHIDGDHHYMAVVTDFDENGCLTEDENGTAIFIRQVDSTSRMHHIQQYDSKNRLIDTYFHEFDENGNVAQYDANEFGVITRAGGSSGVITYKAEITQSYGTDPVRSISAFIGKDEFGEPEYIDAPSLLFYYQRFTKNGYFAYDENNRIITDVDSLRDVLPKVISIEVVDSIAYKIGLKDNDIILLYGDYHMELDDISTFYDFRTEWTLRSVLEADKQKSMFVFRVNPETLEYGIEEIPDLKGAPSDLGFVAHIRYLTKKQRERIGNAIDEELKSSHPVFTKKHFDQKSVEGKNEIILGYSKMTRSDRIMSHIPDPIVLLGACVKDRSMKWLYGEDSDLFSDFLRRIQRVVLPERKYYFTNDVQSLSSITLNNSEVGPQIQWFTTYVDDEIYGQFKKLSKQVEQEIKTVFAELPEIPRDKLLARWDIEDNPEPFSLKGYFDFSKDGTCKGLIIDYGTINYNEGTAVWEIRRTYEGEWDQNGMLLSLTPLAPNYISASCIDIIGAVEDLKKRAIPFLNSNYEKDPDFYLQNIRYNNNFWDDELYIRSVSENCLIIEDGKDGIRFIKAPNRAEEKTTPQRNRREVRKKLTKKKPFEDPIIGRWEAPYPDLLNFGLIFNDEHFAQISVNGERNIMNDGLSLTVYYSFSIGGEWLNDDKTISINLDPATLKFDVDYNFEALMEQLKDIFETEIAELGDEGIEIEDIKNFLNEYIKNKMDQHALHFLGSLESKDSISILKTPDGKLNINDLIFSKVTDAR